MGSKIDLKIAQEKIKRAGRDAAWLDKKYHQMTANPYNPITQLRAYGIWQGAYIERFGKGGSMANYVICEKRQSRKVPLGACLKKCESKFECDNFNRVFADAKKQGVVTDGLNESEVVINVEEEQTGETTEKEKVESNADQVQEESDDTDVKGEIIERPSTLPSNGKAQQLYQQALSLKVEIEVRWFELGKILKEIKESRHYIPLGYTTWKDFCEVALGPLDLKWRAVDYLITTTVKCEEVGIKKEVAGQIGWSKLKEIVPIVTKENKDHWIDVARKKETTVQTLNSDVRVAQGKITEEERKILPKKMTFYVFKEQEETVELTLDVAGKMVGSDKRGYLLSDIICVEFLSGHPIVSGDMTIPKIQVLHQILMNIEAGFKVRFMGEVIDEETGEILVGGR